MQVTPNYNKLYPVTSNLYVAKHLIIISCLPPCSSKSTPSPSQCWTWIVCSPQDWRRPSLPKHSSTGRTSPKSLAGPNPQRACAQPLLPGTSCLGAGNEQLIIVIRPQRAIRAAKARTFDRSEESHLGSPQLPLFLTSKFDEKNVT